MINYQLETKRNLKFKKTIQTNLQMTYSRNLINFVRNLNQKPVQKMLVQKIIYKIKNKYLIFLL